MAQGSATLLALAEVISAANGQQEKLKNNKAYRDGGAPDDEVKVLPKIVVAGARMFLDPDNGEDCMRAAVGAIMGYVMDEHSANLTYADIQAKTCGELLGNSDLALHSALQVILHQVRLLIGPAVNVADLAIGGPDGIRSDTKISSLVLRIGGAISEGE